MSVSVNVILSVIAWVLIIYQMAITQFMFQSYMQNQIVHIGLVGALLSLYNFTKSDKTVSKLLWVLMLLGFAACTSYMW